jgi:hypothetical protein
MKKTNNTPTNPPPKAKAPLIPDPRKKELKPVAKPVKQKTSPTKLKKVAAPLKAVPVATPVNGGPTSVPSATRPSLKDGPTRGPTEKTERLSPAIPAPIPAKSNKPVIKSIPVPTTSTVSPKATNLSSATAGRTNNPSPAGAASNGALNKTTSKIKLSKKQTEGTITEVTDRSDGTDEGNPQPPKQSSNNIYWAEVGRNVFSFYFCFCL